MNTAELTEAICLAASDVGCLLVRNNSGLAVYKRKGKTYRVAYGVGPHGGGGGDLIGLTSAGVFVSIEIKVGSDARRKGQADWHKWVIMRNGRSGIARTVEDALSIIAGGPGAPK